MRSRCLPALLTVIIATAALAAPPVENFTFMQITDIHVSPWPASVKTQPALRGADSLAWICEQAALPQNIKKLKLTCDPPAFAIATGDLTEFGVAGHTWKSFTDAFSKLPCPLHVLPGNHDNTWNAMLSIMADRYGGPNYAFDHGGIHFVCLNSATPQEPVPTIDGTTRTWLRKDLGQLAPNTPVILAMHHPYDSTEFAPNIEQDTFGDLLRDYNVALIIYGHGHNVEHKSLDGLELVMGGTTYDARAGYMLYAIHDGELTVAYHYFQHGDDQQPFWKPVFQEQLPTAAAPRLFDIAVEEADAPPILTITPRGDVQLAELDAFKIELDGKAIKAADRSRIALPTQALKPGWHFVSVRGHTAAGIHDVRTAVFSVIDSQRWHARRLDFGAAMKAGPVLANDELVLADTGGQVRGFRRNTIDRDDAQPKEIWGYDDGHAAVLGTPVRSNGRLIIAGGSGLLTIEQDDRVERRDSLGAPSYAPPVVVDGAVYVGDNAGHMHAIGLDNDRRWDWEAADFAIEAPACVHNGLVIFGAWDGYLYACKQDTGELVWKSLGPKASDGKAARYYAPADCGPIAIGDSIFVCDRGYLLGRYDMAGKLQKVIAEKVAAIALDSTGKNFIARGIDDHVRKFDASGNVIWDTEVAAGRFPVPPTCVGDTIYICSNTGLLSALAASDGKLRWQFQCTPGSYVLAPVTVAPDGTCYVASMDGHLTVVRPM